MAEQEPMTQEPTRTQEHDELSAQPAAVPGRGVAGWFGGLSRGRKLALIWSASAVAVVIALLALGATSGGGPPATLPSPGPRRSPSRPSGTQASTSRWPTTPATPSS